MEITNELRIVIANNYPIIETVGVYYNDGVVVTGFIKEVKFMPFEVTLCKYKKYKGEYYNHLIDFHKAIKLKILYCHGENKKFK